MDTALCLQDGVVYNAHPFSQLSSSELEGKRRLLVCAECNAQAFFRKESKHGRAACFGARPHNPNCTMAAADGEPIEQGGAGIDELYNPGERIVVDFNYGAAPDQIPGNGGNGANRGIVGRRYVGQEERPNARMHRRLSTLLRSLRLSNQFRASDQILEIPGHQEVSVRDFFLTFSEAHSRFRGQYRGYWGLISDAKFQDGSLWINSGGRENISFCIGQENVAQIYERFHVDEEEQFSGGYALIFGEMRISQNGKKYLVIEDVGTCTFDLTPM